MGAVALDLDAATSIDPAEGPIAAGKAKRSLRTPRGKKLGRGHEPPTPAQIL